MKLRKLVASLLLVIALSLILPVKVGMGAGAFSDCILLLEGSEAFMSNHADGLHALIDLLPANRALGLMVAGQPNRVQTPAPLSRTRRAELHAFIEQCYPAIEEVTPQEWEGMLSSSINLLASQGNTNSTVFLLRAGTPLPTDWQQQVQAAAEQGIVLYELDLNTPWAPVGIEHRLPSSVASGGLAFLLQLLGLAPAHLTSLAFNEEGMQLALTMPDEIESLILQWDRSSAHAVLLTTPDGNLVDPLAENFRSQLFEGPTYTCLHLTPDLLPEASDWPGEWVISASGPIGVTAWLGDPVWLEAYVRETATGQRLVCLATNIKPEPTPIKVILEDLRRKPLVQLNDLGINGDAVANDGVYSALLPPFVTAGPATIRLSGIRERSLIVNIPEATVVTTSVEEPEEQFNDKLLFAGLILAASGVGIIAGTKKKRPVWRISHQSVDGHWHCHDLESSAIAAGSAAGCQIRLARATAGEQLRIKLTKEGQLRLDVLAPEPPVCVNDRQVYLSSLLEHGDRITIGGERLFVEEIKHLRVGKRSVGQGNEVQIKK